MILDSDLKFEDLLADFCAERSLSELDTAILNHALDGWPMTSLAKKHGTTANALHQHKRELFVQLREYLKRRGIQCSADFVDE